MKFLFNVLPKAKGISTDTFCAVIIMALFAGNLTSCTTENKMDDNFDRTEILRNVADEIILPGYEIWSNSVNSLKIELDSFYSNPNEERLMKLRGAFEQSYQHWQYVSFFEFGPAEEILLKEKTNVYPTNINQIEVRIENGNTAVPNATELKGYSALDYLLYGASISESISKFTTDPNKDNRRAYVQNLVDDIADNSTFVLNQWKENYASIFKENKGNSDASSISFLLNQFVLHYETNFRKAKLGIPLGIIGATTIEPNPDRTEAFYSELSLILLRDNLDALRAFYEGKSITLPVKDGFGFDDYLRAIGREDIANDIIEQFEEISMCIANWNQPIDEIVKNNFPLGETCYSTIDKMINLIKAEVPSAISVSITYIEEGDGD